MSKFIKNAWYVAAWSDELTDGFLTRRILDTPIVMFRQSTGRPAAFLDRCPHKLAPLSLGRIVDDRLQCGYHGLEFDCEGQCVRAPGQDRVPAKSEATTFPLHERYNAVWIWIGDPELADPSKIVTVQRYGEQGWAVIDGQYQYHRTSYRNIAENLVDPAHTTFVHRNTIGNPHADEVPVEIDAGEDENGNEYVLAYRWTNNVEPPPIDRQIGGFTESVDRCQYYYFYIPCVSRVDVATLPTGQEHSEENKDKGLRAFSYKFLTPETDNRTHFFWMHVRNFNLDKDMTEFTKKMNATFEEDNVIASAIQKEQEASGLLQKTWLAIDAAPSRVRRMIDKRATSKSG